MNAFQGAIDFLSRTQRFIITSHETPDADAIGSECAISKALRGLGRETIILNADPIPRKLAFLDPDRIIQVLEREDQVPADIGEYSLLMLDTNDAQNIGQIASSVLPRVREHFIIDHHEQEEDLLAGNFIQKSASSTAEILYQLLREMNVTIDREMAQALFTGIVYDTGSFIYPKTTAITFEIARDLVAKGSPPEYRVLEAVREQFNLGPHPADARARNARVVLRQSRFSLDNDTRDGCRFRGQLRRSGPAHQHSSAE